MNKYVRNALLVAATAIVGYEIKTVYLDRPKRRKLFFDLATEKAKQTNKKLLVIGDPHTDNYAFGVDYGCGDLCMDINNCPKCPNAVIHDINKGFSSYRSNSYVVFISCTLEYVDDIHFVHSELMRISGGDLFIVSLEPYSLKTLFARNLGYSKFKRKWRILKSPPTDSVFLAEKF
jgi:hypothetical protein